MFALGAVGFLHEILVHGPERPFLLMGCLALMGFPLVLTGDGIRMKKNGKAADKEDPE